MDNPEISYQVELNVNPSDIFFLKKGIETLYFIFDITAENTKLGQFARASRAKLLSRSIKQVKEMVKDEIKLKADIKLKSPNIIIPFDQQKLLETEVWVVSPGDLKIYTDGSSPDASHIADAPARPGPGAARHGTASGPAKWHRHPH